MSGCLFSLSIQLKRSTNFLASLNPNVEALNCWYVSFDSGSTYHRLRIRSKPAVTQTDLTSAPGPSAAYLLLITFPTLPTPHQPQYTATRSHRGFPKSFDHTLRNACLVPTPPPLEMLENWTITSWIETAQPSVKDILGRRQRF